jgi:hypothetical protein
MKFRLASAVMGKRVDRSFDTVISAMSYQGVSFSSLLGVILGRGREYKLQVILSLEREL